jgi:hypothetical protein
MARHPQAQGEQEAAEQILDRKVEALSEFILGLAALIKFIDTTDPKAAKNDARRLAKLLLAAAS